MFGHNVGGINVIVNIKHFVADSLSMASTEDFFFRFRMRDTCGHALFSPHTRKLSMSNSACDNVLQRTIYMSKIILLPCKEEKLYGKKAFFPYKSF